MEFYKSIGKHKFGGQEVYYLSAENGKITIYNKQMQKIPFKHSYKTKYIFINRILESSVLVEDEYELSKLLLIGG